MEITKEQYVEEKARVITLALRKGDEVIVDAAIRALKRKGYVYAAKELERKLQTI